MTRPLPSSEWSNEPENVVCAMPVIPPFPTSTTLHPFPDTLHHSPPLCKHFRMKFLLNQKSDRNNCVINSGGARVRLASRLLQPHSSGRAVPAPTSLRAWAVPTPTSLRACFNRILRAEGPRMRRWRTKSLSRFHAVSFGRKALRNSPGTVGSPKQAPGAAISGRFSRTGAGKKQKSVPMLRNAGWAQKSAAIPRSACRLFYFLGVREAPASHP